MKQKFKNPKISSTFSRVSAQKFSKSQGFHIIFVSWEIYERKRSAFILSIFMFKKALLRAFKVVPFFRRKPFTFIPFLPMFSFDPPENIRKLSVFSYFQGNQKGTLGRKSLTLSFSLMKTSNLRLVSYSFILCVNPPYKKHLNKSKGMDYSTNYTLLAKSKVSKLRLNDETVNF